MGLFDKEAKKLIEDGQLNLGEFKKLYKKMKWVRAPRELSAKHSDFFYIGNYEDDKKLVVAKIRPSMRMAVEESFKGYDKDGNFVADQKNYTGKFYNFGTTVEVVVDDKFMDKIKAVANNYEPPKTQKVSW